jgi:hypothetical protein
LYTGMIRKLRWFWHYLRVPREYKVVNGELYIREGFGEFVNLHYHLREEHGISDAEAKAAADEITKKGK